jgi:predicted peptidase
MKMLAFSILATLLSQQPATRGVHQLTFESSGVKLLYGISIPNRYDPAQPRPLILALHPGGSGGMPYYGSAFMRQVVVPALNGLEPIIIAPDCPTRSWTDPASDQAVMALVKHTLEHYAIDRRRILVVGFSMGGRGTWFMASRHPDLFTGAIPMAASTGDEPIDRLGTIPTYIIHSRDDEVVPYEPAERNARALEKMKRNVEFETVWDIGHFQMGGYVESLRRAGRWIVDQWK